MSKKIKFIFIAFLIIYLFINCEPEIRTIKNDLYLLPPTFLPNGGEFSTEINIEIFPNQTNLSRSKEIKIVYTTDGANPQVKEDGTIINGKLYTGRITMDKFTILKALCIAKTKDQDKYVISDIARTAYSFKAAYPIFTPSTGKYGLDQIVRIASATIGATIYYTTDGSQPSQSSNIYITPITVSKPVTIRAVAYRWGWAYSETKEAVFTFKPDTPNIYPNGGIYNESVKAVISPALLGCSIRYTTDDTTPDESSTLYSGAISITSSKSLKAIAIKSGMENSDIARSQFFIKVKQPYPNIGGGIYKNSQNISLSCDTTGSTILYKLVDIDATSDLTPDTNYTGPINISTTKRLIAVAKKGGIEDSDWFDERYIIDNSIGAAVSPPIFSEDSGSYTPFYLTISSSDSSYIKYTLDGSTPSMYSGLQYEYPIFLETSKTVKAICYKDGYESSAVVVKNYTISDNVEAPIISISPNIDPESYIYDENNGKYICYSAIIVEVESYTPNSVVRWTIDGSDPTDDDFFYSAPISISGASGNITLKVKAFKTGWNPSNVVSATFSFKLPNSVPNPEGKSGLKKAFTVVLSQPVLEAETYYTTDGSDPKTSGTRVKYTTPISISSTTTLKFYSTLTGWEDSDVVTTVYTFE